MRWFFYTVALIRPYAAKIAEAAVQLYASPGSGGIQLIFDDEDLMKTSGIPLGEK